jgi:hypothetical protein
MCIRRTNHFGPAFSRGSLFVNLCQVVELLSIASAHSPNLIEASGPLPAEALKRYACWSELRNRHWVAVINDLAWEVTELPSRLRPLLWQRAETTLVDVLAGGLVARVWGAILTACDRSRRTLDAEKTARDVLAGQLRAQRGALRMLAEGSHRCPDRVAALDFLRRKLERWTDLLLGHLVRRYAVADFAYDLERALDFGDEQAHDGWDTRPYPIWDLYLLCLRSGFPRNRLPGGVQAIWRNEVIESILACLPPELFQVEGPLLSVRMKRLLSSGLGPERTMTLKSHASAGIVKRGPPGHLAIRVHHRPIRE